MKLKYTPKPEAKAYAPGLRPGQVLEVSAAEGKRLLATGAFEEVKEPTSKKQKGGK